MSCDYAVWHTEARLTTAEAAQLYHALCEGNTSGVSPNPAVDAFYAEITALHPEIDDIQEEDIDDHDLSPWSIAFDRSLPSRDVLYLAKGRLRRGSRSATRKKARARDVRPTIGTHCVPGYSGEEALVAPLVKGVTRRPTPAAPDAFARTLFTFRPRESPAVAYSAAIGPGSSSVVWSAFVHLRPEHWRAIRRGLSGRAAPQVSRSHWTGMGLVGSSCFDRHSP